ncbi:hypothetical protein [Thioalkalivibrio paradoxus]|uniref:Uncharacterized protein n=1 Tax=Thioalkalivibrio paradoxus ARh 1 TaxID=713585 RepID=W0DQJ0_9GAMM|nr:hypothetical protein [Thioalkalivibrio paradoxus]AHE99135.1 hypothetical protein THITH_13665 [Thioalkalivibrio paradoxus ARh 1]
MRVRAVGWWFVGLLLAALLAAFLLVPREPQVQRFENLPWQIEVLGADRVRVLGIVLGETTLADLAGRLPVPDIRLFVEPDGARSVEAFFSNARIPPFEANLVMVLDLDEPALERVWEQRTSERPMPSGARRYGLGDAALIELGRVPVAELSYIPRARWDGDLIRERFGDPVSRIRLEDDQDYWLYPENGLAIVVPGRRGRMLMHYATPDRWERVLERLEQAGQRRLDDAPAEAS